MTRDEMLVAKARQLGFSPIVVIPYDARVDEPTKREKRMAERNERLCRRLEWLATVVQLRLASRRG